MRFFPCSGIFIDGAINYPGYDPVEAEKNLTTGLGGPYELLCSVLIVAMVIFILGTFFLKKDKLRLISGFIVAVCAVGAMIAYPINQMSYGGPIVTAIIGMLLIGLAYSVIFIITRIRYQRKMAALTAQAEAAAAHAPDGRPGRRFDD